jgi:type I restriction enzyme R subunit
MMHTTAPDLQDLAKKQFIAKLQVKKNYLTDEQADQFETIVGKPPQDFAKELKTMPLEKIAE